MKGYLHPCIVWGLALDSFKIFDDYDNQDLIMSCNSKLKETTSLKSIETTILNYCSRHEKKIKKEILKEFMRGIEFQCLSYIKN